MGKNTRRMQVFGNKKKIEQKEIRKKGLLVDTSHKMRKMFFCLQKQKQLSGF